ncbi:tex261-like protein [Vairimorpha apis BRL 01]|uniref:Tex261-like protein n=1 Tax=Vairimorpha apis BRL 01 TaxID=1037528 RepID=T0L7Y6_9MICR|nr:tex261-like protein [Vairimorpha apis BRL 01]EQB61718.1 tex261-like protein [Vairimorpha apis BRL 01]
MILDFFKSIVVFFGAIGGLVGLGLGIIKSIEYIEDRAYSAKNKIKRIVEISMLLHFYLLLRCKSIFQTIFSLSIQYSFYCMLEIYPIVKLDNPYFIYGTLASLVNHFLVIRMLFYTNLYSFEVLFVFALIWITPFCFFISLSANDEVIVVKGKTTTNTLIGNFFKKLLNRSQ